MGLIATITSLFFSYFPKVNLEWAKLDESIKKLIMLGIGVAVLIIMMSASCIGWITQPSCDNIGVGKALVAFWYWVLANQITYKITPLTRKYREVRDRARAQRLTG